MGRQQQQAAGPIHHRWRLRRGGLVRVGLGGHRHEKRPVGLVPPEPSFLPRALPDLHGRQQHGCERRRSGAAPLHFGADIGSLFAGIVLHALSILLAERASRLPRTDAAAASARPLRPEPARSYRLLADCGPWLGGNGSEWPWLDADGTELRELCTHGLRDRAAATAAASRRRRCGHDDGCTLRVLRIPRPGRASLPHRQCGRRVVAILCMRFRVQLPPRVATRRNRMVSIIAIAGAPSIVDGVAVYERVRASGGRRCLHLA